MVQCCYVNNKCLFDAIMERNQSLFIRLINRKWWVNCLCIYFAWFEHFQMNEIYVHIWIMFHVIPFLYVLWTLIRDTRYEFFYFNISLKNICCCFFFFLIVWRCHFCLTISTFFYSLDMVDIFKICPVWLTRVSYNFNISMIHLNFASHQLVRVLFYNSYHSILHIYMYVFIYSIFWVFSEKSIKFMCCFISSVWYIHPMNAAAVRYSLSHVYINKTVVDMGVKHNFNIWCEFSIYRFGSLRFACCYIIPFKHLTLLTVVKIVSI